MTDTTGQLCKALAAMCCAGEIAKWQPDRIIAAVATHSPDDDEEDVPCALDDLPEAQPGDELLEPTSEELDLEVLS